MQAWRRLANTFVAIKFVVYPQSAVLVVEATREPAAATVRDDGQRKPLGLHRPLVRPAGAPPLLHPAGEPFRESAGTPGRRRNALLGLATSAVRCACRPHLRERCVLAKVCEAGIEPQTSRPQAGPLSRVAPSLSTARGSRTSGALRRTRHCWRRSAYRSPRAAPAGSQVSGAPTRCRTPTRSRAGS